MPQRAILLSFAEAVSRFPPRGAVALLWQTSIIVVMLALVVPSMGFAEETVPIRLRLELPKTSYRHGEEIFAEMEIRSMSRSSVSIRKPICFRGNTEILIGRAGEADAVPPLVHMDGAPPDERIQLEPEGVVRVPVEVFEAHGGLLPGRYWMRTVYYLPGGERGADISFVSPDVNFEVCALQGAEARQLQDYESIKKHWRATDKVMLARKFLRDHKDSFLSERVKYILAENLVRQNQHRDAMPYLEEVMQNTESRARRLRSKWFLADCYFRTGQPARTLEALKGLEDVPGARDLSAQCRKMLHLPAPSDELPTASPARAKEIAPLPESRLPPRGGCAVATDTGTGSGATSPGALAYCLGGLGVILGAGVVVALLRRRRKAA